MDLANIPTPISIGDSMVFTWTSRNGQTHWLAIMDGLFRNVNASGSYNNRLALAADATDRI